VFSLQRTSYNRSLLLKILLILLLTMGVWQGVEYTGHTTQETLYEQALVTRVIDGDTFELSNGNKVRLLCVNAPEKGEPYAEEATVYLTERTLQHLIFLEKDETNKDKYGRLLRYVYDENTNLINTELVRLGLAEAKPYKPNTKHCDILEQAQEEAQRERIGMWS